jgi:cytochrome c oxidase cbb3-type subunit 4
MYKDVLQSIAGIEIYPVISLILFLLAFTSILVWVIRLDKDKVKEYSRIPLEEDSKETHRPEGRV